MKEAEGWEHDRTDKFPSGVKESALPPHEIRLKVGAPIIAMRNIAGGVSNGNRLVVTYIDPTSRISRPGCSARAEVERRRCSSPGGGSYQLEREQLPVRLAYATNIHKSQGLALIKVGLYLEAEVFAHGVLYVSMSRCGDPDNLFVYGQLDAQGRLWTDNVVYQNILPKYD